MSPRISGAAACLAGLVSSAALYGAVCVELVRAWWEDPNYSHGFFIPPIAAYLAWQRRAALDAQPAAPRGAGLALVALSTLAVVAGTLAAEFFVTRIGLLAGLAGAVVYLRGWRHLRMLAFPLALLLLMVPPPAILFNQLAAPLQMAAARFGAFSLSAAGIPVLREGNLIVLANTTLEVAEACSGIRSLVSLTALAVLFAYFTESRAAMRAAVVASAVPIAVVANGVRVAGTGAAAHAFGAQAAEGFFHAFSGWIVFATAFALLAGWSRLLRAGLAGQPS